MADQSWTETLRMILEPVLGTDPIDLDLFWNLLRSQTAIFPRAQQVFDARIALAQQRGLPDTRLNFARATLELLNAGELDEPRRRTAFWWLAYHYDCIFAWVEERESGHKREVGG
jgi:hypothetical protein